MSESDTGTVGSADSAVDAPPGDAAPDDTTPADATAADVTQADAYKHSGCDSALPGPPMVEVSSPDGTLYCIDSREVSQGEYFDFLGTYYVLPLFGPVQRTDAGDWPRGPGCEWDLGLHHYSPDDSPCSTTLTAFSYTNILPSYPVACVNWCDAYAYCAWAGKRLCGRVGGGILTPAEVTDPSTAEWYNVCSQGGKTAYAYGDKYRSDLDVPTVPVDQTTDCHGSIPPFEKVSQIGCNVREWQDACDRTDAGTSCAVHLMHVGDTPPEVAMRCDDSSGKSDREIDVYTGFRCCHD